MPMTDQLVGALGLLVTTLSFAYYTLWILFTPFLPPDSPLHSLFPSREWAVRIPALLMLSGLSAIAAFVGLVLIKSRAKGRSAPKRGRRRGAGGSGGRIKVE